MKRLRVNLGKRSYDIIIGDGLIGRLSEFIKRLRVGTDAVIITNPAIYSIYIKAIERGLKSAAAKTAVIKIPDTETSKSNREVISIIESIAEVDRARGIFIIAFGGGVVGDVAGFAASVYKRGIPYIQVPTTLLAQVDSSIGGKVAIDLKAAKNLVGAFYQPRLVVSDIDLLKSLPQRQIRSGLAEIIKYGVIEDKTLFGFLEGNIGRILKLDKISLEYIIFRSSRIKANIVGRDEYDKKGIRLRLNYGHTIGHAIEAAVGFSKLYSHGEAIAIGMTAAARIAQKIGALKEKDAQRIEALIKKAGLPVRISKKISINRIMKAQRYDKKMIRGVNRFILPAGIGRVRIHENIPAGLIIEVLKELQR